MSRLSDLDRTQVFLVALTVVTLLTVGILASTSSSAFGAYNPTWEGTSSLRDRASDVGTQTLVVTNTSEYTGVDPASSVAIILSPDRVYTPAESRNVDEFVRAGGTLVVAEDFGPHSNQLLADLGAASRFDGRLLRDERQYYRTPDIVVAPDVTRHSLTGDTDQLTLNHGTVVRPNGSRVLVNSSGFAYLDANRNGSLDSAESMTQYPVVAVERVGQGRVVVVSDPSLFINAMLDRPGNDAFATTLLSTHETMLLDYSHRGDLPPFTAAVIAVRQSNLLRAVVGFAAVAAVAVVSRRSWRD